MTGAAGDRAGGELHARWQALQLLQPVFELVNRAAPRAGFDHRQYDLPQLALRLIDFVVLNQASMEGSVSPAAIVDHLMLAARRMSPDDDSRPWAKVAKVVLNTLLNDGRPHEVFWREPAVDGEEWSEAVAYRFQLLTLTEEVEGIAIKATDPAILVFLQALNTNLADQALALKIMVEIQMNSGEFDKALATAKQATRTAQGLSASLREKLDDTRRDIRSVDWAGEMPGWLENVLEKIGQQLDKDRQLRDLARRAGEDPGAAEVCRLIEETVARGQDVWVRLELYLQQAIPVFLAAQEVQRFQPRGLAAAIDLGEQVLAPSLVADDPEFEVVAGILIAGVSPARVTPQWGLDDLLKQLLREPTAREMRAPDVDDPGELGEEPHDSVPDDIAACATEILAAAAHTPARLSDLLAAGREAADRVAEPVRLLDVLWGAAFYVFVNTSELTADELPVRPDLAAAVAALAAVDDDTTLVDPRFSGPDLLLATPAALDRIDAVSAGDLMGAE
ncbi:hypothetical protein ACGFMK_26045 [Amycolatopsis sp. NPDC049252]|uniref:hypothetical protein n=1 Tax=Amycolatopsis sp. NPDC049252 TaxID=3363933 RepID=UPI003721C3B7